MKKLKNILKVTTLTACMTVSGLFAVLFVHNAAAARVNRVETWSHGQTNGWTDESQYSALLNNPGSYLSLIFPQQGVLMPVADGMVGGVNASGGIFSGDYALLGVTNISFGFMTDGHVPAIIRFILRAVSGREWSYAGLTVSSTAGLWVSNNVPLDYDAGGWSLSEPGATRELFVEDLASVDRIGIRIQQNAQVQQIYSIDNFCLHGPTSFENIKGSVSYSGFQTGTVKIVACLEASEWSNLYSAELSRPGAYELLDVKAPSNYWVKAYIDANNNGVPDGTEPCGEYPANPLQLMTSMEDINIQLTEATMADGLPSWWVLENFGASFEEESSSAEADIDGDGMNNMQEFLAGTDPQNENSIFRVEVGEKPSGIGIVLKWKSAYYGQKFSILGCSDLLTGFSLIQSGVIATPPENLYEDTTATGDGPYFYKVQIEN